MRERERERERERDYLCESVLMLMICYFLMTQVIFPFSYYSTSARLYSLSQVTTLSPFICVSGAALSWFSSFLTDRQYYIIMRNYKSPTALLRQGVPQGSGVVPLLFIIYIMLLGHIMRCYGFHYHCYADNIQIYNACCPDPPSHITIFVC